jgi:hypothetical protein
MQTSGSSGYCSGVADRHWSPAEGHWLLPFAARIAPSLVSFLPLPIPITVPAALAAKNVMDGFLATARGAGRIFRSRKIENARFFASKEKLIIAARRRF